MPLGLRQVQSSLLDSVPEGDYTSPPPDAAATEGLATSIPRGIAEGEIKLGGMTAGAVSAAVSGFHTLERSAPSGIYGPLFDAPTEESDAERDERIRQNTENLLASVRSNPHTTGTAAQVLTGLASGATRLIGGGGLGGAALVGTSEGFQTRQDLISQGVDKGTADALGAGTALFAGAGAAMPGGFGKTLLQRVLSGSAAQTTLGIADRAGMSVALEHAGYDKQASQYRALDGLAIMSDAVLGAGFGAVHHMFAPSTVDAARTANDSVSVESRAPGLPTTPESRQAHVDNMDAAARAVVSGDPVGDLKDVETVPNPEQDAVREAIGAGIGEAGRELTGEPVEAPIEQQRRFDDAAVQRMAELRTLGDKRTPAETAEYTKLLEEDRLAAKVGGRRIRGLQSREALEEKIAAGQGFPHYAYFDLDMFKDINDQFGMHHGDEAIRAAGESAADIAGEGAAFKGSERAGDEFVIGGESPEALQSKIDALRQHLANHTIELYKDGQLVKSRKGLDFSHGIGKSVDEAAAASKLAKDERARLGLRANRGAVSEAPPGQVRSGGGEAPAGAKAGTQVTSAVDAATKLAQALRQLVASKGTDQNAHTQVRDILNASRAAGHDADVVESAAVARAGEGAAGALAGAKASDRAVPDTGNLDPDTREAVESAQNALDRTGELTVEDPLTGQAVPARAALNAAMDRLKDSDSLGIVHEIAAACFGRG